MYVARSRMEARDTENQENNMEQQQQQEDGNIKLRTSQIDEQELKRLLQDEAMKLPDLNIVMSGMAGRFPKSESVNEYEENLRRGVDMVNDQDESRFQCGLWGLPPRAGRLKDLSRFDYDFFGYTQEEANYLDFQLRILYEVVYESILDAGVNPSSLRGTNTGVFFGLHCNEFENALADDPAFKSNGYYAQFAVKVAQYFDLRGITLTFDAACASGFVGLHSAVEALKEGLIDQAIVCSSNIPIHPTDSRADGYVKSEACVSVLLQRKHLARRNYCSFMATMTSVDGYKPEGITFPSDKSQEALIRATKEMARVSTNHVEYLEAHGTGTPAGDPQEARAISSVYYADDNDDAFAIEEARCMGRRLVEDQGYACFKGEAVSEGATRDTRVIGPLLVGSVKTNMGHSEAASGLCALAKVALMLENELIYGGLHFSKPNTNIKPLMDGRLQFVDELRPLRAKIIPLSCYGFGGSNVHVIVRASGGEVVRRSATTLHTTRLVLMFGRNEQTLNHFFDRLLDRASHSTENCLTDDFLSLVDALSLDKIDRLMNYRGFMLVDRQRGVELARSIGRCELEAAGKGPHEQHCHDIGRPAHRQDCKLRPVHLLLPGLGSQPSKANGNVMQIKQFWPTIERLDKLLIPYHNDVNLFEIFDHGLEKMSMCQAFVSIVAAELALVNIVRDQLKVKRVQSMIGHSLGEIGCAYASGAFDEREAVMVAYHLGKACDEMGESGEIAGKMIAVIGLDEFEVERALGEYASLRVACKNGPNSLTVSGRAEEIEHFCARQLASLAPNGSRILIQQVCDSVALHNELIMGQPEVRRKLSEALKRALMPETDYGRDLVRWKACFEGGQSIGRANADYWIEMLCRQVDFGQRLEELEGESIVLELGASAVLESLVAQRNRTAGARQLHYVKLLSCADNMEAELLRSIGRLYQAGGSFDLSNFYQLDRSKPVGRRTPSLGALVRWQHDAQLFVPRYPAQFSKSSAKCEIPVDLVQDRDKYLAGHCVEGRILYPATGYLFLIWRVFSFTKRKIYDACFQDVERQLVPIEFRSVRLMRAVILGNRMAQIYIQFEESTGRFEIKEGGSVVAEGYAFTPTERPNGMLYDGVREQIAGERLQCTMSKDDVYKQFRVNGYDYGDSFQNISECSADGRFCRVKFNGHFVALTDSILQAVFLAVSDYAPTSGGLFLPTRFEYVRFQPEIILHKLRACHMALDLSEGSLNTKAKREMMNKMLEREMASAGGGVLSEQEAQCGDVAPEAEAGAKSSEELPECFFDTYCEPSTGIIVTDGIEMRGVKASPAPRRADNTSELLLESQQFISDFEEPVDDTNLTRFAHIQQPYVRVCNSLALELLMKLCGLKSLKALNGLMHQDSQACDLPSAEEVEWYKSKHLACLYESPSQGGKIASRQAHEYDIRKNGSRTLLSVLDQLKCLVAERSKSTTRRSGTRMKQAAANIQATGKLISERIQENRAHLMGDLLQEAFTQERFIRPLVEQVVENVCMKKRQLRLLEVNMDDGLVGGSLERAIELVEPQLALDYSLAHPEPSRLHGAQVNPAAKTYTLRSGPSCDSTVQNLFQENQQQLKQLDFIIYKDTSCYSLPKQLVEENGLAPVVSSLGAALKVGGYCLLMLRQSLTLAERILLALSEPALVGISEKEVAKLQRSGSLGSAIAKIEQINVVLESRCRMMLKEAERSGLLCVGRKSDANGCLLMLFRRELASEELGADKMQAAAEWQQEDRLLLRVQGDNLDWLDELKANFRPRSPAGPEEANGGEESKGTASAEKGVRTVWLCGVDTRRSPINGLVGMMQALRKELGSEHLRCFYDEFTFKNRHEVDLQQIAASEMFQLALRRNQLWFCVDGAGRVGSFRQVTIDDYLGAHNCLCADQPPEAALAPAASGSAREHCYVNIVTRGDLSSFAWHEAPFKYLDERQRSQLVSVAYSALNFRDIMLASGRLPLDAIPLRLAQSDCLLGLEFSGICEATKRRVMGMVDGRGLATRVICPPETSIILEIPDWMSLKEAATIPVAYATAIMALLHRGRAQRSETILIHAASGGVGQAALHLAAYLGLEVFATVGTREKRDFLLAEFGHILAEERIFNSRDCTFEEEVLRSTKGRGVDLVLNSLAGDKLQASLNCLAEGGRFLEIGKYDMALDSGLELLSLEQNKTFHGILLDKLFDVADVSESFRAQLSCVQETLQLGLRQRFIKPIRHELFARDHIEEAFRFMATGKHIGKVLVEMDARLEHGTISAPVARPLRCLPRFQLDKHKAYLVSGGLGGFGLELCKWLVGAGGARYLLLTSRAGARTGYQLATVRRLEASGCSVRVVTCAEADASKDEAGARQVCDIARAMAPSGQLGGIFHLAMVLRDSLLENMSREDFELVCRPKVEACLNLDRATAAQRAGCDYFVAFSSITSAKGNAGQANYAYANSCLERICERRRARGQHGLAVQWGAVGDVGVAFERLGGNSAVIGGTLPQRIPSCLATLAKLLGCPFAVCSSVLPLQRRGQDRRGGTAGAGGDLVGAIMHVLGIKDSSKVSDDSTLGDLGLDSLMAVEIRQYIEREYDITLNIQEIRSLTIAKIREISERPQKGGAARVVGAPEPEQLAPEASPEGGLKGAPSKQRDGPQQEAKDAAFNGAYIDKSLVAAFVPKLELPQADFVRLNFKHFNRFPKHRQGAALDPLQSNRPIFFLPPIHGQFDKLETVCASIRRPCIGLNWTRRLGSRRTLGEAVEVYLQLLRDTDWARSFALPSEPGDVHEDEHIVDLVGYSFGATVAFELMLALHESGGSKLKPGNLVLLDGSPRQIELGSQYLSVLTKKRPLNLEEKVDELLMVYIISNTKRKAKSVNYSRLQEQLNKEQQLEAKVEFASRRLAELLGDARGTEAIGKAAVTSGDQFEHRRQSIAYAMEAFCRKYELINNYKAASERKLPSDCTLIRAEKLYLSAAGGNTNKGNSNGIATAQEEEQEQYNQDLGLSSLVGGRVELHVMRGDHETFLNLNYRSIGEIIMRQCCVNI